MFVVTPAAMAEIHTKLATGPAIDPDPVEVSNSGWSRIMIAWRELPGRVAAMIAIVGGVLWLLVRPTAPAATAHAAELLRQATAPAAASPPPPPSPPPPGRPPGSGGGPASPAATCPPGSPRWPRSAGGPTP